MAKAALRRDLTALRTAAQAREEARLAAERAKLEEQRKREAEIVARKEAEERAWRTVNKQDHGGKKPGGSGRKKSRKSSSSKKSRWCGLRRNLGRESNRPSAARMASRSARGVAGAQSRPPSMGHRHSRSGGAGSKFNIDVGLFCCGEICVAPGERQALGRFPQAYPSDLDDVHAGPAVDGLEQAPAQFRFYAQESAARA